MEVSNYLADGGKHEEIAPLVFIILPQAEKKQAAQVFLLAQRAAILPFHNHDELYLFEVFVSMKYKTCLNSFETH